MVWQIEFQAAEGGAWNNVSNNYATMEAAINEIKLKRSRGLLHQARLTCDGKVVDWPEVQKLLEEKKK